MNEEHYILFDKYLQNELSLEERSVFEKQLSEDKELSAAFGFFKESNLQMEHKFRFEEERESFKENLESISKKHFNNQKSKVISFKPWQFAVAASVALLFGMFFFMQNSNPNFEDFNHYENAYFTERGVVDVKLKQAQEAFNSKDYIAAVSSFEVVLKEKDTPEIQYFYGISLLETNKIDKAEAVFFKLKSGTSIYKNKATWSLALLKLKQKDYKSCKEILLTIPSDYEEIDAVQKLLKELD